MRGNLTRAVTSCRAVRDYAVLERHVAIDPATEATEASLRTIPTEGAVADRRGATDNAATECVAAVEIRTIPIEGAVANRQCPAVVINAATCIGTIPVDGASADHQRSAVIKDATAIPRAKCSSKRTTRGCDIRAEGAVDDRQGAAVVEDSAALAVALACTTNRCCIFCESAVVDGQRAPIVKDAAAAAGAQVCAAIGGFIPAENAVVDRELATVVDTPAELGSAVPDGQLRESDLGTAIGDSNHGVGASTINNCRRSTGPSDAQADADGEILCIG